MSRAQEEYEDVSRGSFASTLSSAVCTVAQSRLVTLSFTHSHSIANKVERSLTARDLGVIMPRMKASLDKLKTGESEHALAVREQSAVSREAAEVGIDVLLLEDSLAKTPWERMQANDDALRFADSLRVALEQRHAKSERTDAQAG